MTARKVGRAARVWIATLSAGVVLVGCDQGSPNEIPQPAPQPGLITGTDADHPTHTLTFIDGVLLEELDEAFVQGLTEDDFAKYEVLRGSEARARIPEDREADDINKVVLITLKPESRQREADIAPGVEGGES